MEIGSQCSDVLVRVTIMGMVANLPRVMPHKDHLTCSAFLFPVTFWRIPWTEELGGLLSMGSHRVGHD